MIFEVAAVSAETSRAAAEEALLSRRGHVADAGQPGQCERCACPLVLRMPLREALESSFSSHWRLLFSTLLCVAPRGVWQSFASVSRARLRLGSQYCCS